MPPPLVIIKMIKPAKLAWSFLSKMTRPQDF